MNDAHFSKDYLHPNIDLSCLPDQKFNKKNYGLVSVIFILKKPNLVLLQLRDDIKNINFPNSWGPPGGHCNDLETPINCAYRELKEETNYQAKKLYWYTNYFCKMPNGKDHIVSNFWTIFDDKQEIKCFEGQKMEFIEIDKLQSLEIHDHNITIINIINNDNKIR